MICPIDRTQMLNFKPLMDGSGIVHPLPSGGISNEDVYETWYVYRCPSCGRTVKEAYRCEVLLDKE